MTLKQFTRGAAQLTSIHAVPSIRTAAAPVNHSLEMSNLRKSLLGRPGLLGVKRGMVSWFTKEGKMFPATVIEIDNCEVVANKTVDSHGYWSVLLGQIDKLKNVREADLAKFERAGVSPKRHLGEFRVRDESGLVAPGTELRADYFAVGQLVDVHGVSKGKGFAGVMKRHGFGGLNASHGVSRAHRHPGGSGGNQDPGRVLPGKKMPGHMGARNCTVWNNEVLHADGDAGILVLKGQVPGPNNAFLKIHDAKKVYGKSVAELANE
ncbi:large ribosomal subunit protein uL3m [Diutina catenulata]